MYKTTVAIIDQGVDFIYCYKHNICVKEVVINEDRQETDLSCSVYKKKTAHGTNIAAIIHNNVPEVKILSVKLRGKKNIGVNLLVKALQYCSTKSDIRIINISLGILTNDPSEDLVKSCLQCFNAGKIIVASVHQNMNKLCYPAALPYVYGVGIAFIKDVLTYEYLGEGYINVLAKGVHQRVLGEDGIVKLRSGTSYAAASFTAIVSKMLVEHGPLSNQDVKAYIISNSKPVLSAHYPILPYGPLVSPNNLGNFDFKKDWLAFAIDDEKIRKANGVFSRIKVVMKYPQNFNNRFDFNFPLTKKYIDGFLSPNLFDHINVLLLGNFFANGSVINIQFGYDLIDLCIKYQKSFVVSDQYIYHVVQQRIALTSDKNAMPIDVISLDAFTDV